MNKHIRNTMFDGRETAAATPEPMRKLDFEVGDVVQIRPNAKNHVGGVGLIIGSRYKKMNTAGEAIMYTVKFNDTDAADFIGDNMRFIRRTENGKI